MYSFLGCTSTFKFAVAHKAEIMHLFKRYNNVTDCLNINCRDVQRKTVVNNVDMSSERAP